MTGATIKVSKLDAARRQLDSAIEMWFRDGDTVSIHALVFNAHQIIQDINEKRGNKEVTLLGMAQRLVKPEHVEEVMKLWKKPVTFLKHANRDPHDILEFNPELPEILIVLCIVALGLLGEQLSDFNRVFTLWESIHKPHLFLKDANPVANSLDIKQMENMRQVKKHDFLNAALLGIAKGKTTR